MTILILTEDSAQGQALAAQMRTLASACLCLVMAPGDGEAALREVRVDCVVCPPAMAAGKTGRRPRYAAWPEGGPTEAWTRDLVETASRWDPLLREQ